MGLEKFGGVADLDADQLRMRRSSTAEQAADVLRGLILRRGIEPGSPLRELELAPALGVSRNTMREALRILGREGLIAQDRHRIATVTQIGVADVEDIFRARRLLELGAVEEARRSGRSLDLNVLELAVNRLGELRGTEPWWAVIEADLAFHVALVQLAQSPRLSALYAQIEGEIRLCLSITSRLHVSVASIEAQHRSLLTHLREGDTQAFTAELDRILNEARDLTKRGLREQTQPPAAERPA